MIRYRGLGALALSLALLGATAGCAGSGQCGYRECPEEAAIRVDVEQRIAGYPELRGPNMVYVQVHGHLVTLSGQVNSDYERRLAERVAGEAAGVARVVNMIGLTYSGR
jgi:osmotically-inducible protein OsmY